MSTIGFIGLGMMGSAMVRRLLAQGQSVHVWNRTFEKAVHLGQSGAIPVADLDELVSRENVVLSMLSTSDVVEKISSQIRQSILKGGIHIDMSTVSPVVTARCELEAREAGYQFIHAPVLGSVPQATDGSLLIFAGGNEEAVTRVLPILNLLGKRIFAFGSAADATHMKLCCNFFISSMIMTLGQGMKFASAAGIDNSTLLEILASSALGAPMYETKGKNILNENFDPRFLLKHMLKDVKLFKHAAEVLHADVASAELLEATFQRAADAGLGSEDYSSVVKVL